MNNKFFDSSFGENDEVNTQTPEPIQASENIAFGSNYNGSKVNQMSQVDTSTPIEVSTPIDAAPQQTVETEAPVQPANVEPVQEQVSPVVPNFMAPPPGTNNTVVNTPVQPTQPEVQQETSTQTSTTEPLVDDEELTRAYVGEKYDKIYNGSFNIGAFFFTSLYMLYRKMYLYSILLFIFNLVLFTFFIRSYFLISLVIGIIVGLFMNKVYLVHASNKVEKIKVNNPGKSREELQQICANKGGTSGISVFLGMIGYSFITVIITIILVVVGFSMEFLKYFKEVNESKIPNNRTTGTLVQNVTISGYMCFNGNCTVDIESNNTMISYKLNTNNNGLLIALDDYEDYIRLDIYCDNLSEDYIIIGYKIYNKKTNEDITSVQNEEELKTKLGLSDTSYNNDYYI